MISWPHEVSVTAGEASSGKGFVLTIRKGEKFFLNGAVVEAVNRTQIRLLNDAHFLLESHVMQEKDATTPLRQLYFVAQAMLMNPSESSQIKKLYVSMSANFQKIIRTPVLSEAVRMATEYVQQDKPFLAMRILRGGFAEEEALLCERRST